MPVTGVNYTDRFRREYSNLPPALQQSADDALRDLMKDPIPRGRRFHSLGGYKNPKVYTIDVTPNKAYKISLELNGAVATLRRVATHREINRQP